MADEIEEGLKEKFKVLEESIEEKLDKIEKNSNFSQKFVKICRITLENIKKILGESTFGYQMAQCCDDAEDLGKTVNEGIEKFGELKKSFDEFNTNEVKKFEESKNKFGGLYNKFKGRFSEILENCGSEEGTVELRNVDYFINEINTLKEKFNNELKELEELEKQFEASKNKVDEKLKELKDSKKLKEKTYDTYKRKVDYISKIHNGDSKFKIKTATARMNDLDNILKGELNKYSSEFKSLEELKKEKLEENETKESKVKNYIKAKIGNARYLEAEVVRYSKEYKGKNEFIPLGEMREIYGTKGDLMMICRLEDGSVKNKKLFSAYRRFCKKILENYRSLKVEAAIAALEGDEISASSFKEEDAKELNSMLYELNNLMGKDTSKFPLANPKDKKFNLSKFFSSTKSQIAKLKNTKGEKNKNRKELIDKVIKKIRKIESQSPNDSFNIDASMEREEYIEKYDNFVYKSAELAVTYLKTEGDTKIRRFASQGKWIKQLYEINIFHKERDLTMDACKVALMCLVAVCSKDKGHIAEGKKYFRKVKKYLDKYIG